MTPTATDPTQIDMKERILGVASRMFARRGFSGTSVQAIAEDVGIRKPSLLYHYPSKAALREAVLADLIVRWQARVPGIMAAAMSRQFAATSAPAASAALVLSDTPARTSRSTTASLAATRPA